MLSSIGENINYRLNLDTGFLMKPINGIVIGIGAYLDEYFFDTITAEKWLEHTKSGNFTPPSPLKEQLSRMNEYSNDLIILCRRKK
jgi:hypothetical protein